MHKKGILIFCITLLVVAIAVAIYFIVPKNVTNGSFEEPEYEEVVEIYAQNEINLTIFSQPYHLVYSIESNTDYELNIFCNNDVVYIQDDYIYVNKVGECILTIQANTLLHSYSKNINVEVKNVDFIANFLLTDKNNNILDKVMVGDEYVLKIQTNIDCDLQDVNLLHGDNISILNYEKADKNNIIYELKITNYGEVKFTFVYKQFDYDFIVDCFEYISTFNVSSNHNFDVLYLFDENFVFEANQDEKFNDVEIFVSTNNHTLNKFDISLQNDNAVLINNKIVAKNIGVNYLIIKALDNSNYTKTIKFEIKQVEIEDLYFNQTSLTLNVGESKQLSYIYSPIYAITNFDIDFEDINYENGYVTALNSGEFFITIKDIITGKIATCSVKVIVSGNINITIPQSFLNDYNAVFENDVLTINKYCQIYQIVFYYSIIGDVQSMDLSCNVQTLSGDANPYVETFSNLVMIDISSQGEYLVTLSIKEISYTCKIIINS